MVDLHWRRLGLEKCKKFCRQLEKFVAYTVRRVEQRHAGISLTRHAALSGFVQACGVKPEYSRMMLEQTHHVP